MKNTTGQTMPSSTEDLTKYAIDKLIKYNKQLQS